MLPPNTACQDVEPQLLVRTPHPHDVLCGRGKSVINHPGNKYLQAMVSEVKLPYVLTKKTETKRYTLMIYDTIKQRNPPGRFLKRDEKKNLWYELDEMKAREKVRQALSEGGPELLNILASPSKKRRTSTEKNSGKLHNPLVTMDAVEALIGDKITPFQLSSRWTIIPHTLDEVPDNSQQHDVISWFNELSNENISCFGQA